MCVCALSALGVIGISDTDMCVWLLTNQFVRVVGALSVLRGYDIGMILGRDVYMCVLEWQLTNQFVCVVSALLLHEIHCEIRKEYVQLHKILPEKGYR